MTNQLPLTRERRSMWLRSNRDGNRKLLQASKPRWPQCDAGNDGSFIRSGKTFSHEKKSKEWHKISFSTSDWLLMRV